MRQTHTYVVAHAASEQHDPTLRADVGSLLRQAGTNPPWLAIRSAKGAIVVDTAGKSYIDLFGNNCHHIGYAHPALLEALARQMQELPFVPRGFTNDQVVVAAERLSRLWPYGPCKITLVPGGSAAVEVALMLCRAHTGRYKTLSYYDAYHGRSAGALSLGGRPGDRSARLGPLLPGTLHVPPFYPIPNASGAAATFEGAAEFSLYAISTVLRHEGDIAALFAEPIRNGGLRPPKWYWPKVRALCDQYGVLLVADEIPTGLGKTGRWFATQHLELRPDITLVGKALGGAVVPVAAVIASEQLDTTADLNLGYFTYERSPVLARAASTVLDIIDRDQLVSRSETLGTLAERRVQEMAARHPVIRSIYPAGLMLGVAFHDRDETGKGAQAAAAAVFRSCLEHGVLLQPPHQDRILMSFPLIISTDELLKACDIVEHAIEQAAEVVV
jgi:4-aminobutyrate aminotransferase